ncbi:hypothetical protein QDD76_004954 [Burkholderia cepacia]|jgi:hypothetical protein|uniref:Uncharacterized protein n=1 Tax=Burkholderia contaminans TaxID=488447 RepID=A0ABD7YGH5_9BURK|nr:MULTISPECIES: hypothetical protein [Burkholderia]EKS9798961.1 hypothetical protein [Burkholderia cepacia]EKS9805915.1 hypothetical protein [Burkholderia cepacia]EKS9813463.1 hypothetical protein [Burkholderia cepacia]EKS9820302.1 hypothetical protein [Burkholderia cepacia]EKS9828167.1 hypothetical protein [Burkholderia cepacia]
MTLKPYLENAMLSAIAENIFCLVPAALVHGEASSRIDVALGDLLYALREAYEAGKAVGDA